MQKENFTVDSKYKGPNLLECFVDKYKNPSSFSMLSGNKQKKWLILDMSKKEFRYQPDKAAANKAKSIVFDIIQILRVDLSKPGKYYIDMVTKERPYRFKFPNIDSWVVFTEALRHVKAADGAPLFPSTEAYLTACIKYHEQYEGNAPKTGLNSPIPDLATVAHKPEKHEVIEEVSKPKETVKVKELDKKPTKPEEKSITPTLQTTEIRKVAVKEKKMKLDSDSEHEEEPEKHQNEIVKKRKNV